MLIQPTDTQLIHWSETYIPEEDFFFIDESAMGVIEPYIAEERLYTRKEFFEQPDFTVQELNNSYMYWALSSEVTHVIVADPLWVTELPEKVKSHLLGCQIRMRQGLIFPKEVMPAHLSIPEEHVYHVQGKGYVVMQRALWGALPDKDKGTIISAYAQLWDVWQSVPLPDTSFTHLKKYANTFSTEHGANCLAATIYGITSDEQIIHSWMTAEEFSSQLNQTGYVRTEREQEPGDVLAFEDEKGVIQHAAFHIGEFLYFNKNGQMFFNPWKVIHLKDLLNEWGHLNQLSFRNSKGKEMVEE